MSPKFSLKLRICIFQAGTWIIALALLYYLQPKLSSEQELLLMLGLYMLLMGVTYLLVNRYVMHLRRINQVASLISAGKRQRRIELGTCPKELAEMAETLNTSFDYLDEVIEHQKQFSADASHELRTPISVVIAQAQAGLKRERTPEEYQRILKACMRSGQRMKLLANNLLDLAQIETNTSLFLKEKHDLNLMLKDAVQTAQSLTGKHDFHLSLSPQAVDAEIDMQRMHQAFMNILTNAIRYNPKGCKIHSSLKVEDEKAIISIADDGVGFDAHAHPKLFERFYRIDPSRSREYGGSGLGLSIVKSFVELHKGTVTVEAKAGQGATFYIRLPLS